MQSSGTSSFNDSSVSESSHSESSDRESLGGPVLAKESNHASAVSQGLWLGWFSKLHVACVLFLIFLGGHVKSHEAGLAVPDWPTSFGYNMFTFPYEYWVGGIWHEHVHRLVASFVGFLTIILMVGVWRARPQYRALAVIMLVAVCVQGLLGGLTVLYRLPAWLSSSHGMLAQVFLCMSVAMAFLTHHQARTSRIAGDLLVRSTAVLLIGALFLQLGFGAFVRHTESGLAVLDFPTVAGQWLPSVSAEALARLNEMRAALRLPPVVELQVVLHLLHRYWAIGVCALVLLLWRRGERSSDLTLRGYSRWMVGLTVVQVSLGIAVVLTHRIILPTSFHVVVGATMMALCMLTIMRATRRNFIA